MLTYIKLIVTALIMGVVTGSFLSIITMSSVDNYSRLDLICKDICGKVEHVEIMIGYNMSGPSDHEL